MYYSTESNHFSMAEVEAICAKLQNKPVRNGMLISVGNSDSMNDELGGNRRKRKTNATRYMTYIDREITDASVLDRSCGALDLTVNQSNISESVKDEAVENDESGDKNNLILPNFLQSPLINIFMNNKDIHENFKCTLPIQKPSTTLTNSDSKSDDEIKVSVGKIPVPAMDRHSQTKSKSTIDDCLISQPGELHEDYIKRFLSYEECREEQCRQNLLRDHFHCNQCEKIIIRREEMIRHSKWHKKREESLQFNFMRFSPGDDCKEPICSYNGRQTHYHCLHAVCNKIYISTSDVQMHSNFHKKDAAINQEGFQRYRATELCGISTCSYNNQRTTHFHCMRENCKFTFKNKADMDKHKGHHQRNDSLSTEGFRKYIKYEHCDFNGCKFSKLMNHIHCVRENCDYVVHSSAQINSHRRKHERRVLTSGALLPSDQKSDASSILNLSKNPLNPKPDNNESQQHSQQSMDNDDSSPSVPNPYNSNNGQFVHLIAAGLKDWENSLEWTEEIRRFTANDPCVSHCGLLYKDHYHCLFPGCNVAFKIKERIRDHIRRHKIDGLLLRHCYDVCGEPDHVNAQHTGSNKTHYHCGWPNCNYIRLGPDIHRENTIDFNFLQDTYDHFELHESRFHLMVNKTNKTLNKSVSLQSSDGSSTNSDIYQFNTDVDKADSFCVNAERKRGRPPKYKKNIHIPTIELIDNDMNDDETISELTKDQFVLSTNGVKCGFKFYPASNVFCADDMCMYHGRSEHFHCLRQRCHHATDSVTAVNLHRREFHHYMQIDIGYEYFDRSINCRRSQCQNNRVNNHYHCVRLNCDYSFKRFNTMHQHTRKHVELERHKTGAAYTADSSGEPVTTVAASNYSAITLLADYSRTFKSLFTLPACNNDRLFFPNRDNIPTVPNSVLTSPDINFHSLMNLSSSLSPFHISFKAFMENNAACYPLFPQVPTKMPRLQ